MLGSKSQYLTEMDVVYGDDEPFYGFERVQGGKVLDALDKKWESVDLAFRRGMYGKLSELPPLCILKLRFQCQKRQMS